MSSIETPLIGSGSPEEVERRTRQLIDIGRSQGFLTFEELNERLPDELVSPDKLDSLLMMLDEMGIRLIDSADVGEFQKGARAKAVLPPPPSVRIPTPASLPVPKKGPAAEKSEAEPGQEEEEDLDLNLEEELAEASSKRIDDPVRMYLTQMGEIPLLARPEEISLAKRIEVFRKIFRSKVLESDYCLNSAVEILQQVDEGDLPFDRTMKISTAEGQADKGTIGQRIPMNLETVRKMLARNQEEWVTMRQMKNRKDQESLKLAIRRRR